MEKSKNPNQVSTAYMGEGAWNYDERRFKTPQGKALDKMELKQLENATKLLKKDAKIFEVGCGTGRFSQFLANQRFQVVASDPSADMIEVTKKKCDGISNINFQISEGANLDSKPETYDLVFAIRVLNQTESKDYALKTVREMIRITKPGGYVLIEFMNQNRFFSGKLSSSKTTWLTFDEVISTASNQNCEIVKTEGILFFPQRLLNAIPSLLLPFWVSAEKIISKVFKNRTIRGYVLLQKLKK